MFQLSTPTENFLYARKNKVFSRLDSTSLCNYSVLPTMKSGNIPWLGSSIKDVYAKFLTKLSPKKIAIQVPCFDMLFELPRYLGLNVDTFIGDIDCVDADIIVISNPTNPTGYFFSDSEWDIISNFSNNKIVIVDAIMSPEFALSNLDFPGLIISSLKKIYGINNSSFATGVIAKTLTQDMVNMDNWLSDKIPDYVNNNRYFIQKFIPITSSTWYGTVNSNLLKKEYGVPISFFGIDYLDNKRISWSSRDFISIISQAIISKA